MLRPGGFPEYSPAEQKIFDMILETIASVFKQHNYEHIWTPAVESVDILSRGGDIFDKQVYGLYGLAQVTQGEEDYKDYALHFDLTIPLARYVLDHRQELTFPFRRYQMQPVWRGERQKRGRFKEFRQFDIDVVRPAGMNVGVWYDTETIAVMDKTMDTVCKKLDITIDKVLKISHIGLTRSFLEGQGLASDVISNTLGLLDNYYKLSKEDFAEKLKAIIPSTVSDIIFSLIENRDYSLLQKYPGYEDLMSILSNLDRLGVKYDYDICIVRGHGYYKGIVCEWFEKSDIGFGTLTAGGRYDQVTDFIDPKQSFSGVGMSLGRFVYLAIEKTQKFSEPDKYLFLNFDTTQNDIIGLYNKFLSEGKVCELYPVEAKFGKQLEYADKKGMTYAVILGDGEKENNHYIIKTMKTGEQTKIPL